MESPARTARIEARITPENLGMVRRAAEIQGRSVSDFVVTAAQEAAQRTIAETQIIHLTVADQHALAEAIQNPPPLAPTLQRAITRRRSRITPSR